MEKLYKIINKHPDFFQFSGNKSRALVAKAEEALGVRLPESYKAFLMEFGLFSFGGIEYYGILHDDFTNSSGIRDVVRFNLRLREEIGFPAHLIAFINDDGVQFTCLDTSSFFSVEECSICIWDNVAMEISDTEKISFLDYLLDDVTETLEYQFENE